MEKVIGLTPGEASVMGILLKISEQNVRYLTKNL
jgi:hypothetical protein